MNEPVFDECLCIELYSRGLKGDLVIHRNAEGDPFAWHSPLDDGPVNCTLCTTPGQRVYLS